MAGTIYKLDRGGHGAVAKWGEETAAGASAFAGLLDAGCTMFDFSNPADIKKMTEFDETASLIVAVPWRSP